MSAADQDYENHREVIGRRAGVPDKFSFFFVFLIGSAGIVTLRTYFGIPQVLVIVWSVSWMFIYLLFVTVIPRYRLRPDQAGDNLYYLGFLYTLVSLSVALYFFTHADAALDQIISNFGIALATTIIGIALRVVLHQMREDPVDTEREARHSLAEATNKLRAELDISVREMSSFVRQMKQTIEEALHGVGDKAGKAGKILDESGGQVAQATKSASEGIAEALSNFSENTKSLNAASRRHMQATDKLIGRIESIEVPMDLIDRKIAPALEQIIKLVGSKLTQIENQAVAAQGAVLREQVVTVEDLRGKVTKQVEAFEEQLRDMRESGAGQILDSMRALSDRQAETFERIAQQAEDMLASLQQSRQAMEDEVDQAREATREVMQQLASMVQTLGNELSASRTRQGRFE